MFDIFLDRIRLRRNFHDDPAMTTICKGCMHPIDQCECHLARSTDESTSHEAAAVVTRSGKRDRQHQEMIYLVKTRPGHTAQEYGRLYGDKEVPHKRLPELCPGHIRKGIKRDCQVTGRKAITWWPQP